MPQGYDLGFCLVFFARFLSRTVSFLFIPLQKKKKKIFFYSLAFALVFSLPGLVFRSSTWIQLTDNELHWLEYKSQLQLETKINRASLVYHYEDIPTLKFWKIEQVFLTGILNLHKNSISLVCSRTRGFRETAWVIPATQNCQIISLILPQIQSFPSICNFFS